MALWSRDAFLGAINGKVHEAPLSDITGVSIDSRTVNPGEAFFAIKGDRFDGHDFAPSALENGAAVAVVSEGWLRETGPKTGSFLAVDDVLEALRCLGRAARARNTGKVIGVTGSVGKTGTKEALALALSESGQTHAPVKSFNNHWGVPLTLARFPEEARYGVFEIGMNSAGEITPLTKMVRPHVAIVTTVAPVHLEFFDSVEGIADAKSEIFLGLEPGGVALINRDNAYYERMKTNAEAAGVSRLVTFGEMEDADMRLLSVAEDLMGSDVEALIGGERIRYRVGAPGRHWAFNSVIVLAAVHLVGADVAKGAAALAGIQAPKGRGATSVIKLSEGEATLIDESYNANPASMRAALSVLGKTEPRHGGRRIAVLGDMLELGDERASFHVDLAVPMEAARVDRAYLCGPEMAHLHAALPPERRALHSETSDGLTDALISDIRAGDVVMVKGSLGSRMGVIIEAIAGAFS